MAIKQQDVEFKAAIAIVSRSFRYLISTFSTAKRIAETEFARIPRL